MSLRIEVDPIKCEAHGLCAELLPERITLDEWGYPLIDGAPIPASLAGLARRAARANSGARSGTRPKTSFS